MNKEGFYFTVLYVCGSESHYSLSFCGHLARPGSMLAQGPREKETSLQYFGEDMSGQGRRQPTKGHPVTSNH